MLQFKSTKSFVDLEEICLRETVAISLRSVTVILGGKKPLFVLDASRIADGCGSAPVSLTPTPCAHAEPARKATVTAVRNSFMISGFYRFGLVNG